jgi:hypothetical protein
MERKPSKKSAPKKSPTRRVAARTTITLLDLAVFATDLEGEVANLRRLLDEFARAYPDARLDCPSPNGLRARRRPRLVGVKPGQFCLSC